MEEPGRVNRPVSGQRVDITLSPSWQRCALTVVTHCLALASLPLIAIPVPLVFGLGLALIASLLHSLRHCRLQDSSAIQRVIYSGQTWQLWLVGGDRIEPRLSRVVAMLSWLVVLRFTSSGRDYYCVVLPDSAHAEEFRRLRVFLGLASRTGAE